MRRYHDRNIQTRSFNIGDMVLHRIQDETGLHKLNSRWEGPFIVTKSHGTRILSTDLHGRTRSPQLLEHQATLEVLPITCQEGLLPDFNFQQRNMILRSSIQAHKIASGVFTPTATSNTNLSLFTQSQRHGESSSQAKGHEPCCPRDKFSTVFRSCYSISYIEYQSFFVHSK